MGSELNRRLAEARMTIDELRKCAVCGEGPYPHNYMHAFTTMKNDLRDKPAAEPPKRVPPSVISTDIVLRLALMKKGVLTTDDLLSAEEELGLRPSLEVVGQSEEAAPGPDHVD